MASAESKREPCPDRILDDTGGAFGMGAVGGSAFHFLKGTYNSPSGHRLIGGAQAVRMNAPRVGGSFAVWGGLFSVFDCSCVYLRQKEDPWNSIIAGAATGGFLQMRHGFKASARSAAFGGVLLGLIEGAGLMLNKMMSSQQIPPMFEDPQAEIGAGAAFPEGGFQLPNSQDSGPSDSGSLFGNWFSGRNKESDTSSSSSSSKTEILESYDTPLPNLSYK